MTADFVSQIAGETRVLNVMENDTATPHTTLPRHLLSASEPPELDERRADLRRRRAELVDVLADTLLEQVLNSPRGTRTPADPTAEEAGAGD